MVLFEHLQTDVSYDFLVHFFQTNSVDGGHLYRGLPMHYIGRHSLKTCFSAFASLSKVYPVERGWPDEIRAKRVALGER